MDTTQPVEMVDNAIAFGAIAYNVGVMTAAAAAAMLVYALRSLKTQVTTIEWVKGNAFRFALGFGLIVVIGGLVVISPEVAMLLGVLGFQAEQSPVALGLFVATILIGATTEPTTPEGE